MSIYKYYLAPGKIFVACKLCKKELKAIYYEEACDCKAIKYIKSVLNKTLQIFYDPTRGGYDELISLRIEREDVN